MMNKPPKKGEITQCSGQIDPKCVGASVQGRSPARRASRIASSSSCLARARRRSASARSPNRARSAPLHTHTRCLNPARRRMVDIQAAQNGGFNGRSAASSVKLAEGRACSLMGCQERAARAPGAATRSRSRLAETCVDRLLDECGLCTLRRALSPCDHHNGAGHGVLHPNRANPA
jgi:hypothetical protein